MLYQEYLEGKGLDTVDLKRGLSVSLLTYKEGENLKVLLPQIKEALGLFDLEYEIVVVDTEKALDDTPAVCEEHGCRYVNQRYPGFGGAFKTAIECAAYDKFLILDGDGSHPPRYIPDMLRLFANGDYDVVIGSRYVKGGKTNDSKSSVLMSKILNTVFRIALGIKAHDISTDFRIYRTSQLKQVSLEKENYDVLQEVLLKIKLANGNALRIGEVPISFEKRLYGESKRRLIPFIISYIKTLIGLLYLRFRNLINYLLIGAVGAVVDFTTFSLLTLTTIPVEAANVIGALLGFAFTFSMNTFVNFRKTSNLLKRLASYGSICIVGALVSTGLLHILKERVNVYILKACLMIIVSLGQYLLNKSITYGKAFHE